MRDQAETIRVCDVDAQPSTANADGAGDQGSREPDGEDIQDEEDVDQARIGGSREGRKCANGQGDASGQACEEGLFRLSRGCIVPEDLVTLCKALMCERGISAGCRSMMG